MKKALKQVSSLMDSSEGQIRKHIHDKDSSISFYGHSIHKIGDTIISMARDHRSRFIMVLSSKNAGTIAKFSGEKIDGGIIVAKKCPLNERNAGVIRELFPWTAPVPLNDKVTTIGCGDRLNIATPGHISAVKQFDAFPVLIQNSIKQLKLTQRTFQEVVDDTSFLVYQSGYQNGYGADANQLKNISDINIAMAAGIPMYTLDLEEYTNTRAKKLLKADVEKAFEKLPQRIKNSVSERYFNREFQAGNCSIRITRLMGMRCAVMYYKAIDFIDKAYQHINKNMKSRFDLEIALTDKTTPTLPEEHVFIINELINRDIKISSLAPKFVGTFYRGLDYSDSVEAFADNFEIHCNIAKTYGNYKISIHTGSDKYKIYPAIGKLSKKHFHLKTAGTSWLEALSVIAEQAPVLYRIIHQCALDNLSESQKYYDEDVQVKQLPDIEDLYDKELVGLLSSDYVRQLLHISYGPILNNRSIRPMLFSTLHRYEEDYHEKINNLFVRHLTALKVPKLRKTPNKR